MNRDYINWLESLPCNRKRQIVNQWMGEWAPLPEEIYLPRDEETQQRLIEHDCPNGVMAPPKQWLTNSCAGRAPICHPLLALCQFPGLSSSGEEKNSRGGNKVTLPLSFRNPCLWRGFCFSRSYRALRETNYDSVPLLSITLAINCSQ